MGFFGSHAGNLEAWEAEFCAAALAAPFVDGCRSVRRAHPPHADEQALPWG